MITLDRMKQAMLDAGIEVYRIEDGEIRLAERVRMHLMDSGVAVSTQGAANVKLTVRSQRSDFPASAPDELFRMVRTAMQERTATRGFREVFATVRDITDPVDATHVLDTWHEVTFNKEVPGLEALIDDVRWALDVPKCIDR
jgi:hypothetical protein